MANRIRVIDLEATDDARIEQVAAVVVAAFAGQKSGWHSLDEAREEVRESFADDRLSLIALDADDVVLGWVGAIRHYDGYTWELHPLAVDPVSQGSGVGRALVTCLEDRIRSLGGHNIWLTTDDGRGLTNLDGVDLYPDVLSQLQSLRDIGGHPITFYEKQGFSITGAIPDAYAPGHHELVLSKRIA
jgi:aminoglycoside 6'-N-acetyltransferase I